MVRPTSRVPHDVEMIPELAVRPPIDETYHTGVSEPMRLLLVFDSLVSCCVVDFPNFRVYPIKNLTLCVWLSGCRRVAQRLIHVSYSVVVRATFI